MTELEKYQAFHQRILQRKQDIPAELEALRQSKKEKTVQFKELLSEKLLVEMILTQLRYAGLEAPKKDLPGRNCVPMEDEVRNKPIKGKSKDLRS